MKVEQEGDAIKVTCDCGETHRITFKFESNVIDPRVNYRNVKDSALEKLQKDLVIIETGTECFGCKKLHTKSTPMVGEEFICSKYDKKLGYIGKLNLGSVIPREYNVNGCKEVD